MMDPPKRTTNPPDFLIKLLTMVQDEAASLIQWNAGKLFIHDPLLLERRLSAYFRRGGPRPAQRATRPAACRPARPRAQALELQLVPAAAE